MASSASPRRGKGPGLLKRWAGVLVALALWPVLAGYTMAFVNFLTAIPTVTAAQLTFLLGATIYLGLHTIIGKPLKLYVFGHELMHAVAMWCSGGQVKAFKVSAKGGSVSGTKTSLFIALAPYLIPIFSVVVTVAYLVAGWFSDVRAYASWFYGLLGGTLAFHLAFTGEFVKTRQPDLIESGRLLSLTLIYWVNLALVALAVALVTPGMLFWNYLSDGYLRSAGLYAAIAQQLFSA